MLELPIFNGEKRASRYLRLRVKYRATDEGIHKNWQCSVSLKLKIMDKGKISEIDG
jgi:hypothetical protein